MPQSAVRLLLRLSLALNITAVPVLPAWAALIYAGTGHGAHAGHHGHPAKQVIDADDASPSQEDNCHERCCLACAPYFADVAVPPGDSAFGRSIQIPVVKQYYSRAINSPPDRPPRVAF